MLGANNQGGVFADVIEVEQVHQVSDRGGVGGHIGVSGGRNRIGEVVAASAGNRGEMPVGLDEFQDGAVIVVGVIDVSLLGVRRDRDQGNAGSIAEEVDGLDIAGVVVAASFVHRQEDRGLIEKILVDDDRVREVRHEILIEGEAGVGGVAGIRLVGADE